MQHLNVSNFSAKVNLTVYVALHSRCQLLIQQLQNIQELSKIVI